jgi:hypothetical protein
LLVASQALIGHPRAMYLNAVIAGLHLAFLLRNGASSGQEMSSHYLAAESLGW